MKEGGKVGKAAKAVANVLHPHFEKEEEYALPQRRKDGYMPTQSFYFQIG